MSIPTRPAFPRLVSFTLTHACPLRCHMCGQHSESGYVRLGLRRSAGSLGFEDWVRLVDEIAAERTEGHRGILLRGGEPFVFPKMIDLVRHARGRAVAVSIDTSGVLLEQHAESLAQIGGEGGVHVTVSVDGPPEVHDAIRGVPGTFERVERGLRALHAAMRRHGTKVTLSLTCTFSEKNFLFLNQMPDIARRLEVPVVTIVPVYWIPEEAGRAYEEALSRDLGGDAISWRGFPHTVSGVDPCRLLEELRLFRAALGDREAYPYMPLSDQEYAAWFSNHDTPVGVPHCRNADSLLDIQPDGRANFCVDFADYFAGNVQDQSLLEIWNGHRAERFCERLARGPLPTCLRCGARYMGEQAAG